MMMAAVVVIIISLLFGMAYEALSQKNAQHSNMLKTEHQIKIKY